MAAVEMTCQCSITAGPAAAGVLGATAGVSSAGAAAAANDDAGMPQPAAGLSCYPYQQLVRGMFEVRDLKKDLPPDSIYPSVHEYLI
jgi:hypothetical protein